MKSKKIITVLVCLSLLTACESKSERQFKKGCEASGGDSSVCSCVYDKMKEHYPSGIMEHITDYGWQMPNDFPSAMLKSSMQCRGVPDGSENSAIPETTSNPVVVSTPATAPLTSPDSQSSTQSSDQAPIVSSSVAQSTATTPDNTCESNKVTLFNSRYQEWVTKQNPMPSVDDQTKAKQLASLAATQSCADEKAAAIIGQPSFNCAKASSSVEHMICSTPTLATLDVQLKSANQSAQYFADDQATYKQSAVAWLKTRNTCTDVECVSNAYKQRLATLNQ